MIGQGVVLLGYLRRLIRPGESYFLGAAGPTVGGHTGNYIFKWPQHLLLGIVFGTGLMSP